MSDPPVLILPGGILQFQIISTKLTISANIIKYQLISTIINKYHQRSTNINKIKNTSKYQQIRTNIIKQISTNTNKYSQHLNKYLQISTNTNKTNKSNHVFQHLKACVWPVALSTEFVLCEYYVNTT